MKIAFLTASVSRNAGGLFESIRCLAKGVFSLDYPVVVFGVADDHTEADSGAWRPLAVKTFASRGPARLSYAPGLSAALSDYAPDILHSHSLWNHTSMAAGRWYRKTGKPYVVHPHGMLDPWAVRNSYLRKFLAELIFEKSHLQNAACLRALCESEARSFRAYGLKNPVCIIPNGIDLPPPDENGATADDGPIGALRTAGFKTLLYLGRIHPKKGLVNLLHAWRAALDSRPAQRNPWVLAIAGWDEKGHEMELKKLVEELGIPSVKLASSRAALPSLAPSSVIFLGPQFGGAKAACYRSCHAYILPSFSEGLPMTVLEAWSYGKPVVMTPECNLPEGFVAGAAVHAAPAAASLELGLRQLFEMSDGERRTMGAHGLNLVAGRFGWAKASRDLVAVCRWILGGGAPPEFVQLV
jgi:poly(glycerol-phosphate) alpha-glucosyltransferase